MKDAPSGIRLDRRALLASGVAVAAGLAGCNEESGDRAEPGDTASYVPASASAVVGADMALAENEETRAMLEAYTGEDDEDVLQRVESRTGVDLENVDEVLSYSEKPRSDRRTLVVDGEFDAQEIAEAAEEDRGVEYESVDHDNGTLYEPSGGEGDEPWVGTAAEGQYVIGEEGDVRTALDVFAGDEDALEGPLRDAFEDAREYDQAGDGEEDGTESGDEAGTETDAGEDGETDTGTGDHRQYVASATDEPRAYLPDDDSEQVPAGASLDLYEELDTATATYAAADGEVAVDIDMRAPDEDTAGSVAEFTRTIVSVLQNSVDDDAVAEELAQVAVERDGSVATVAYRSDAEGAATLAAWLAQM